MTPPKAQQPAQADPVAPADPLAEFRQAQETEPTEPVTQEAPQEDPLARALGELAGFASRCWDPKPEGVFQSEEASAEVERVLATLRAGHAIVTQEAWDEARAQVIAGWHADTVAVGFLHKGGNCGCRYLAGVALTAAMPVQGDLESQDA